MTVNDALLAAAAKIVADGSTMTTIEAKLDAMILLLTTIAENTEPA